MTYAVLALSCYIHQVTDPEEKLTGGNVTTEVVRIGTTVRKPTNEATPSIEALLKHLEEQGFTGAPKTLGRDEQGRHILEYIPGSTVHKTEPLTKNELHRLGQLIRELHTAAESFIPPADAKWNVAIQPDAQDLICHHDLAPWNLVRDPDNDRWVFIDWDGSGPGSRLWDLAYAGQSFVPLQSGGDPSEDAQRLAVFAQGHGLDRSERERVPRMLAARTEAMYQLLLQASRTGQQPWARLYAAGHGDYWRSAAEYIRRHENVWQQALRGK